MVLANKTLAGWGNYPRVDCQVARPERVRELRETLDAESLVARGLGRSYGDPAVSDRGVVVDCTRLDRYVDFDAAAGILRCEAGVSLEMILRDFGPRGFIPMITPGTKYVTVGGCIANDVHGKAHHKDGCFSRCVDSFRMMTASGEIVQASREENPDLFWANFGGMGLLGVIVDATIRLRPVETTWFRQQSISADNLDQMIDALEEYDAEPYSVAWVDSLARGSRVGRGVLAVGDHARLDDLTARQQKRPLATHRDAQLAVPFEFPSGALNSTTIRMLNVVFEQIMSHGAAVAHYEKFFYPLDFLLEWNRGYGSRGFTQYQFVIPLENGRENMRGLLEFIAESGQSPFLNVLKRFGPEQPETMLSFPMEGYTYAVDFPIRDGLAELLSALDRRILDLGGRVYLGKDAFLDQRTFEAMYPRLDAWREIKARWDPKSVFTSNLGRRLGLSQ